MRRALALALVLSACSTVQVKTDWDSEANFAGLHTWAWQKETPSPTGNPRLDDPLVHKRIQAAIQAALAVRGYAKVDPGRADFEVAYHVAIEQRLDARTIYTGYGPYPGWSTGGAHTVVDSYDLGTL